MAFLIRVYELASNKDKSFWNLVEDELECRLHQFPYGVLLQVLESMRTVKRDSLELYNKVEDMMGKELEYMNNEEILMFLRFFILDFYIVIFDVL